MKLLKKQPAEESSNQHSQLNQQSAKNGMSKTQNYSITKIIDENDTLEDETSELNGDFLEITQTIETDLNHDSIEISNFNDLIQQKERSTLDNLKLP